MNESLDRYYPETYLHRMFLTRNESLRNSGSPKSDTSAIVDMFIKEAEKIKTRENSILRLFGEMINGKKTSAVDSFELLKKLLASSESANKEIVSMASNFWEQNKGNDVLLEDSKNAFVNALEGIYEQTNVSSDLASLDNEITSAAKQLFQATVSSRDKMYYGTRHGYLMEKITSDLLKNEITKALKQNDVKNKFEILYTGNNVVTTKKANIGVKSMPDLVISATVNDKNFNLPLSLKTKVTGKSKTIGVLSSKPLTELLKWGNVGQVEQNFLKTALIHQHYWGNSEYQSKVIDAYTDYNGVGMTIPTEINPIGTTEFALERMDYNKSISALHPAIDIMYNAFIINLFLGFEKDNPNLFTVIQGSDSVSGGIVRSSDVLLSLANNLIGGARTLTFNGFVSKENTTSQITVNGSIVRDAWSEDYREHDVWRAYITSQFENVLSLVNIKTQLNYSKLYKEGKL